MQGKILKLSSKAFAPLSIKTTEGKMLYAECIAELNIDSKKIRIDIRDIKSEGKIVYQIIESESNGNVDKSATINNRYSIITKNTDDVIGHIELCWDSALSFKNLRVVLEIHNKKYIMYYFNMKQSGIKLPIYCNNKQIGLVEKLSTKVKGQHDYAIYSLDSELSDIVILMTTFYHLTRVELIENQEDLSKFIHYLSGIHANKPDNIKYNFNFKDYC